MPDPPLKSLATRPLSPRATLSASFLLYLGLGAIAMLIPEALVPDMAYSTGNTRAVISARSITLLVLLWTAGAYPWLSSLAKWEKDERVSAAARILLATGVGFLALLGAWVKPVLTLDPHIYIAFGRQLAVLGSSPYEALLSGAAAADPVLSQMAPKWFSLPCPYGPVALGLFGLVNKISQPSLPYLTLTVKLLLLPFYGLLWATLWRSLEKKRLRVTMQMSLVANPVLIWLVLVDAHVDLLILAFLLLSVRLIEEQRPAAGGVALAISAGVKFITILPVPLFFLWLFRRSPANAARFLAAFGLVYGTACALIRAGDIRAVLAMQKANQNLNFASIIPRVLDLLGVGPIDTVAMLSNALFGGVAVLLCIGVARGDLGGSIAFPVAALMAIFVLTRTGIHPWYTLWFWPLLSLSASSERGYFQTMGIWTVCVPFTWWAEPALGSFVLGLGAIWSLCLVGSELSPSRRGVAGRVPLAHKDRG